MLLYANDTPQKDMETFVSRHGHKDPSDFTIIHLMQSLQVSSYVTEFYRNRLFGHVDEVDPRVKEDYDFIDREMVRMRLHLIHG